MQYDKVALVYDRVNKWGGAERVLLMLHEMFPDAPLYTSVYSREKAPWANVFPEVIPSFLQKFSFLRDRHELLAPLMSLAFESFDFSGYDLVISVTSEAAKGVITKPGTLHVCYCLTPTRYLWSHYELYFKNAVFRAVTKPLVFYLKHWDLIAAQRPDEMVAISLAVRERIRKYYAREVKLIFPPLSFKRSVFGDSSVDRDRQNPEVSYLFHSKGGMSLTHQGRMRRRRDSKSKGFYLVVSRLVKYKRVDLVIEALNELGHRLIIVGSGKEEGRLKKMAGRNIKFVKNLTDSELAGYYQNARALIFPQEEDFGLVSVEAQAAGCSVIAYGVGGALDTVIDTKTGIFFDKQDKKSLISAINRFEKLKFSRNELLRNAKRFTEKKFKKEFLKVIGNVRKKL